MNEIIDLLYKIKERPGMYLGHKSLAALSEYLNGYRYAKYEDGIEINVLPGFNEWIVERYAMKSIHHWSRIIAFYNLDQGSAFDRFYELLEEFLKSQEMK